MLNIAYFPNAQTCERLMTEPSLYDSLMLFAKSSSATLQMIIVRIIQHMSAHSDMRILALEAHLDQILLQVKHNASDREAWNMADSGMT